MRHKLSRRERIKGLKRALRSPRTKPWLKPAMARYLHKLERGRR